MSIIAHVAVEAEQAEAELDRVLAAFDEDGLLLVDEPNPPPTDMHVVEIRAAAGEVLARFHQACVEHGIVLEVRRIHHDREKSIDPAAVAVE